MTSNRPHSLTLRGAANNEKPDAGGRGLRDNMASANGSIWHRRTNSPIARALFAVWLFGWPVAAFAQPANVARLSAFTAPGASAPGQFEEMK